MYKNNNPLLVQPTGPPKKTAEQFPTELVTRVRYLSSVMLRQGVTGKHSELN